MSLLLGRVAEADDNKSSTDLPDHRRGQFILLMPRLLNFTVAIYLIAIGVTGLFGTRFLPVG